ncbi:MAG: universal stress protein [Saprospiraceae bacterium]|nr:universal stress protein [Saprospiraceae bacterium]
MKTNNIVLIPTDFSEVCDNAIQHGVALAKNLSYKASILHVIDKTTKSDLKKEDLGLDAVDEKLKEIAEKYQKEFGIDVSYISKEGSIFSTISEVAEEIGANLLMLGTHGKIGIQHLTGSFALKVITSSPSPVIVVQKRHFADGYNDIVFPIHDISEVRQKVKWAIHIAETFKSKIHLYVINSNDDYLNDKLRIIIKQVTQIFDRHKIEFVLDSPEKEGNFAKQVLDYAVAKETDLIMTMTNPDMFSFILSKWDEQMIFNQAQIPVMCINPVELGSIRIEL